VTDVYDWHGYADDDRLILAAMAARHVLCVVERTAANVVSLR